MYPSRELARLAERKRFLQARIAVRRSECVLAAAELARPIGLIDRGIELWRRFAPLLKLVAFPGAFALGKLVLGRKHNGTVPAKSGRLAKVMAAVPLVLRGVKLFSAFRAQQAERKSPATAAGI